MIKATRTQWIKFAVVLALYLIFLVWLRSWLGLGLYRLSSMRISQRRFHGLGGESPRTVM